MRILAISHLYPNLKEKRYGIFVARQLSEIRKLGAEITVMVPRVWCPGLLRHFYRWKNQDHKRSLCRFEGIETISIPYLRLPGNFYNRWSGLAAFRAMKSKALELHKSRKFDVIYAIGGSAMREITLLSIFCVLLVCGSASAQTPDGETPANEGACDVLLGATPGLYGLCVAFCEEAVLVLSSSPNIRGVYAARVVPDQVCRGCRRCTAVCPEAALRLHRP